MVTGTGAVIGLLMAAGMKRFLESMLFELTPRDPRTFLAARRDDARGRSAGGLPTASRSSRRFFAAL